MKERRPSVPNTPSTELDTINLLSRKEAIDVVAGVLCHCATCQKIAEPALAKSPMLRKIDRTMAQDMWKVIRKEIGHAA